MDDGEDSVSYDWIGPLALGLLVIIIGAWLYNYSVPIYGWGDKPIGWEYPHRVLGAELIPTGLLIIVAGIIIAAISKKR